MKVKLVRKPLVKAENVEINTDFIKLDALLKFSMLAESGGEAKLLIQDGVVSVNGEVCVQRGKKIKNGDIVICGGKAIKVVKSENID